MPFRQQKQRINHLSHAALQFEFRTHLILIYSQILNLYTSLQLIVFDRVSRHQKRLSLYHLWGNLVRQSNQDSFQDDVLNLM